MSWLLEADQPAVRLRALIDLEGRSERDSDVREARATLASRGWADEILSKQKTGGYWESVKDLYMPKYVASNWMAIVLSDMGLTKSEPRIESAAQQLFTQWLDEFKDKPEELELCIVGNLARYMTRFGYSKDRRVRMLFDWLVETQKEDGGWHCFPSKIGTLDCWEGLAAYAALPKRRWTRGIKRSAERGAEFYLQRRLTEEGQRYAPWLRIHYPVHYYYDFLVGLDTLVALGYGDDRRLGPALHLMKKKRRPDGTWALDASHPDLGRGANYALRRKVQPLVLEQPGLPSKIATLTCMRILAGTGSW